MKKLMFTFVLMLGFLTYAQENQPLAVDVEQQGNMHHVVFYHANGSVAQEGYIKKNLLHGKWVSYSPEGNLISIGYYKRGKRTGNWMFWSEGGMTEVTFKRNAIEKYISWENSTPLVLSQK